MRRWKVRHNTTNFTWLLLLIMTRKILLLENKVRSELSRCKLPKQKRMVMNTSWHNWEGRRQQWVHKVPFSRCKLMPCTITQEWPLLIPLLSIKWLITMLWWVIQWHCKIITTWQWLDSSRWCRTQYKLWTHLGTRKGLQVTHNLPFSQCNQHRCHKDQWFLMLPPRECILCKLPKLLLLINQPVMTP